MENNDNKQLMKNASKREQTSSLDQPSVSILSNLQSPSGYAMPFELAADQPLEITLGYGEQIHPQTGKQFFHYGVDFKVKHGTWLKALATGVVTGISSDVQRGFNITVNYRNYVGEHTGVYEVVYTHIRQALCNFGKNVKAGENIAQCDELLHIEVRYNGATINPLEFLTMIRDNLVMNDQMQMGGKNPEIATLGFDVSTPYDDRQDEIDRLMQRFFGRYMIDLAMSRYRVPDQTERAIRDLFVEGARDKVFYEHIPTNLNPLGLGEMGLGLMSRAQTILVYDFLNYLALIHNVFLNNTSEDEKKKFLTAPY